MKITLSYSVITKENTVIPNVTESFICEDTDEGKAQARARWVELKAASFVANLKFQIEKDPVEEHIVTIAFKTYDYKVKGKIKRGQYVTVLSGGKPVSVKVLEVDPPKRDINYVYVEGVC